LILEGLITKNINKSPENANKNFLMKRKYIRQSENMQKSMVKKKRGRQCLPMARRQCKEESKKIGSTVNEGSTKEKRSAREWEYENVSDALLS